ncbi:uncharacterized protein LOC123301506 [Chrysoperla carnea]|uniref:uncharacterized protein LOC123301506 n=1 Tax=Chrysoperla carnea TaxID=189513 RepID=UPI001D088D07|nr:uncharacterized protein LOC123301506 [Chrysoperla carnea]
MRFLSLLCFVVCALFVNSKNVPADNVSEVFLKNRENFANGFDGSLPSLDPLNVDSFSVVANTPFGQTKSTLQHVSFKGFNSFDKIKSHTSPNGNFAIQIHVPKIEMAGDYTTVPAVLDVAGGQLKATLNDITINIAGETQKSKSTIKFNNVHVQIVFKAPTTNIELKGKNITEEYLKTFKPLLASKMGSLLSQATKVYQSEISEFVANYLNAMHEGTVKLL